VESARVQSRYDGTHDKSGREFQAMKIIKRNGSEVAFDLQKIINAIKAANKEVPPDERLSKREVKFASRNVKDQCAAAGHTVTVEEIQDLVEDQLMALDHFSVARKYIIYRYVQNLKRHKNTTDDKILSLIESNNEEVKQENSNKNPSVVSVQRDYMAGEVSKDLTMRELLPSEVVTAHDEGIIHFHDADYYAQHMHNCDLVNLEDMLQNGTVISGTMIEKPHSFSTACNIATQIIAQVASCQYGGQSISLAHLAPFVDISRKKIRRQVYVELETIGARPEDRVINQIVEKRLRDEVARGVQTIQYQVVTLMTTNGQAPFITVFMYLGEAKGEQERRDLALCIEEMLRQRYQGVKNEAGVWITPAFPKLIYVLEEDNVHEDSRYFYLTKLAAKCTARRMVPDYISEKKMREYKLSKGEVAGSGDVYTCMGCRSFLTPDRSGNGYDNVANAGNWEPGKPKYYGRFNQGVVTINLPDVALSSGRDPNRFWELLDERLELCHTALRCRHERLKGTLSDAAPILWQHGALARLKKGETIDRLLYGGYSTISLGYAGLYECVRYMTGHSHTDKEATPFALAIMQRMNDRCSEWKAAEDIDYSLYGTPLESTTYKFAKCLQRRFGLVEGINDHGYITNSYHVNVRENIDAFTKLKFESEFQRLSPGGAISYVEVPNMQDNLGAVIKVIQYIYENIMYAELNTKCDYCQTCGYSGEIHIVEDDGKLVWECPNCHNRDQSKMNVARRTCGYIGTQYWNQGRTEEIRDRVLHL
jgi:anaerobic ribonucleoside-triphosphate reductase